MLDSSPVQGHTTISSQMGTGLHPQHGFEQQARIMGHGIFATFVQNSCGREAESGPCLLPLVQSQMGETNMNSTMTPRGTLSDRMLHHLQGHPLNHSMTESHSEYPWMVHSQEFPFSSWPWEG